MEFHMKDMLRGSLIMLVGLIILLHTLGIVEKVFSFVLILLALGLIVYGFYVSGFYAKLRGMFQKK